MIRMGGAYFTVVGVQQRQSSMVSFSNVERTVVLPATLVQQLFGFGNTVHMLAVAGRDDVDSRTLQEVCKKTVFARHIIAPDDEKAAWIMAVAEFIEKFRGVTRGIRLLTWIVGLGTLLAGIVGVSNIMLVTIKERTQEIGIRRAIGAPPGAILSQILSESFVLTFIAGVLGLTAPSDCSRWPIRPTTRQWSWRRRGPTSRGRCRSAPPCWRWPSSAPAVCWQASFRPFGH